MKLTFPGILNPVDKVVINGNNTFLKIHILPPEPYHLSLIHISPAGATSSVGSSSASAKAVSPAQTEAADTGTVSVPVSYTHLCFTVRIIAVQRLDDAILALFALSA